MNRDAETKLRLILLDIIGKVADASPYAATASDQRSRSYFELELSRIQSAVHRLLAFMDDEDNLRGQPS